MNIKKTNSKNSLNILLSTKYFSLFSLFILGFCIFMPSYLINFYELPKINNEIFKLNEKINNNLIFSEKNDNDIYEKRLENLEAKYIDVIASKDTINFWLTILLVIIPVILGYTVYTKNKMLEQAENDLKQIRKLKESAEIKINEAELKATETFKKIDEKIDEKIYEFEKKYIEKLEEIGKKGDEEQELLVDETKKQMEIYNLYIKALKLYEEKKYLDSLDYCDKILLIDVNNINTLNLKGVIFIKINDLDKSLDFFKKNLINFPDYSAFYYNIACVYSLKSNIIESINYLNESLIKGHFNKERNIKELIEDNDFINIRNTPEFISFIQKIKDKYSYEK